MEYDCIIIGAGIGGLASALKLTSFGKKILVLERQSKPGGFVNTFKRNGFTFESAIHCIDALGKDGEIRKYLKEFDIEDKIEFIELENFAHIIYPEYNFILDFKRQNLLEFLNTNFPHEKNNILRLFNYLNKFYKEFDNFSESNLPIWIRAVGSLFFYPKLVKISKLTVRELFKKFIKDEKLFAILADLWKFIGIPPSKASALYFLLIFRGYYLEPTSYIRGGSSELIKVIVEKIKKCGGDIIFNTEVKKIITDKGKKVKGVITDTKEFKAKTVISNANSIDTLTKLIDNDKVKEKYNWILNLEKSLSAFQVYLGLSTTTKKLGLNCPMLFINTTYDHETSFLDFLKGNYDECFLEVVDHSQIDSTLAPPNKSTLLIITFDNFKNWSNLGQQDYQNKKIEVAKKLIRRVERYLPNLSNHIEVMEIATPRTMHSFTLSPDGAIYGFTQTPKQSGLNRLSQRTKVKGLYLAGAWTQPGGGFHGCFLSGIEAADLVLNFLK